MACGPEGQLHAVGVPPPGYYVTTGAYMLCDGVRPPLLFVAAGGAAHQVAAGCGQPHRQRLQVRRCPACAALRGAVGMTTHRGDWGAAASCNGGGSAWELHAWLAGRPGVAAPRVVSRHTGPNPTLEQVTLCVGCCWQLARTAATVHVHCDVPPIPFGTY